MSKSSKLSMRDKKPSHTRRRKISEMPNNMGISRFTNEGRISIGEMAAGSADDQKRIEDIATHDIANG